MCNRETGRFGSKRGRTGGSGIDFDHDNPVVFAVVRELNVGSARHADRIHNPVGIILQTLLNFLRDGQHRSDTETVSGMHAHRIDIFNETDGDLLPLGVADHFQLQLLPAEHALFHEHLPDQAGGKPARHDLAELLHVIDDTAAGSAHRIGRAEHHGITEFVCNGFRLFHRVGWLGVRNGNTESRHGLFEFDAVFTTLDRVKIDADHLHIVFGEDALFMKFGRKVECSLSAEVRQERIGLFLGDDLFKALCGKRLDVGVVRHAGVRHDGGGIGVDQNDLVSGPSERLACLGPRIIEFTCLSDNDRAGTDDQDLFDVRAFCHLLDCILSLS